MKEMGHSVKKSSFSTINDWEIVLRLINKPEKIIGKNEIFKLSVSRPLILPLEGAKKKLKGIDTSDFYQALRRSAKPVIFSKNNIFNPKITVIKFTGLESYNDLIVNLSDDPEDVTGATIIISPNNLTKSKRKKECELVTLTKSIFESTSFIKLPLNTFQDYIKFAAEEKASLLLMPYKDLPAYIEMIKHATKAHPLISVAFQPDAIH